MICVLVGLMLLCYFTIVPEPDNVSLFASLISLLCAMALTVSSCPVTQMLQ